MNVGETRMPRNLIQKASLTQSRSSSSWNNIPRLGATLLERSETLLSWCVALWPSITSASMVQAILSPLPAQKYLSLAK